jgi:hypothetical protein
LLGKKERRWDVARGGLVSGFESGDLNVKRAKRARVFELDRTTIHSNDVLDRHFGAALARPSPLRDEFQ